MHTHFTYTGPLPSTWSRLRRLTSLDLSHNKLSGPLPAEYSELTALTKLRLGRNVKLSEAVPASWDALRVKAELDIGASVTAVAPSQSPLK